MSFEFAYEFRSVTALPVCGYISEELDIIWTAADKQNEKPIS